MEISTAIGPVTILAVKGAIDSNTFREVADKAETLVNQGYDKLVLDLHEVDYISSAGLVALQTIVGRAASHGGQAVLCSVTSRVAQVLELTGFAERISIFPDLAAATSSFGKV